MKHSANITSFHATAPLMAEMVLADGAAKHEVSQTNAQADAQLASDKADIAAAIMLAQLQIEQSISLLRAHGGADAELRIAELSATSGELSLQLNNVQRATSPTALRSIAASVRSSVQEARKESSDAQQACAGTASSGKAIARLIASTPVATGMAARYIGKPLTEATYNQLMRRIVTRVREFQDGMQQGLEELEKAAKDYAPEINLGASIAEQKRLLESAQVAAAANKPAEASQQVGTAAILGLRDAEKIAEKAPELAKPLVAPLVKEAENRAKETMAVALDQIQLEARKDCTAQGKEGEKLDACVVDTATVKIDTYRMTIIQLQVETGSAQDEAQARTDKIMREALRTSPLMANNKQQEEAKASPQTRAPTSIAELQQALRASAPTTATQAANDNKPNAAEDDGISETVRAQALKAAGQIKVTVTQVTVSVATLAKTPDAKPQEHRVEAGKELPAKLAMGPR